MSSFFFHKGDAAAQLIAPPPPEYADVSMERAMWQAFGQRVSEMSIRELEIKTAILLAETHESNKTKAN